MSRAKGFLREGMARWIAWCLPRRVVYWCALRAVAHATGERWKRTKAMDLTVMDCVARWDKPSEEEAK